MTATGPAGLPWPEGDPGQVRSAARRLKGLAGRVAGAASDAARAAEVSGWEGPTRVLYQAAVAGQARPLASSAGPLGSAAGKLSSLAGTLSDAQAEIRRLAIRLTELEDAATKATTALQTAQATDARKAAAENPLAPAIGPAITAFPSSAVQAAMATAQQANARAAAFRTKAEARAKELCDDVEQADRSAASAVDGAAAAAPAGGATPSAPGVPGPVQRFAPFFMFAPGERYLPADLADDYRRYISQGGFPPDLAGMGDGAPIFYRYDRDNRRIDYWVWRRYNDFRNLGLSKSANPFAAIFAEKATEHFGDLEGVSVQLGRDGQPTRMGFRQHDGPMCSVPWPDVEKRDGRPAVHEALGSGASYPRRGSYDDVPGPLNDLAGAKPGESETSVDAGRDLRDLMDQPFSIGPDRLGPSEHSPKRPFEQDLDTPVPVVPCPAPDDDVH